MAATGHRCPKPWAFTPTGWGGFILPNTFPYGARLWSPRLTAILYPSTFTSDQAADMTRYLRWRHGWAKWVVPVVVLMVGLRGLDWLLRDILHNGYVAFWVSTVATCVVAPGALFAVDRWMRHRYGRERAEVRSLELDLTESNLSALRRDISGSVKQRPVFEALADLDEAARHPTSGRLTDDQWLSLRTEAWEAAATPSSIRDSGRWTALSTSLGEALESA